MAEAKRDARHSVELMKERYQRIVTEETQRNGLVIIIALYGNLTVKGQKKLFSKVNLTKLEMLKMYDLRNIFNHT